MASLAHSRRRLTSGRISVFDNARYLRKMEVYLADLILHRPQIDRLHQLVTATYEAKIRHMGEAGADGIMIGEDLGTQTGPLIGPTMWRDIFKPIYSYLTGVAHDYGMKVLPTGDRAYIEAEAKRMIDVFGRGLILKNYPDLHGIGVDPQWDQWAYEVLLQEAGAVAELDD